MPNDFVTTADVAIINDADLDIRVNDVLDDAPILRRMFARTIRGKTYKYRKKTANPVVGFRPENDGRDYDKPTWENKTVSCAILDASFREDVAVTKSDERGTAALLAELAGDHLASAFSTAEGQLIYGTDATNGFPGLAQELDQLSDALVLDGGGISNRSSVWFIRTGSIAECHLVWGEGGEIDLMEPRIIEAQGATGSYPAWYVPSTGYVGLQYGSIWSVGRIANLDDGANGLDDDKISQMLSLFPSNRAPTFMAMTRRSQQQLQASRTATNPTGTPAPFPTDAFGIPIVTSDQISNAESAVA